LGGWGLVGAALVAEGLAVACTGIAFLALRRLSVPRRAALGRASVLLSPFAAPRAAELVLEATADGVPPAAVLRELLQPDTFAEWARPRAFDVLRGVPDSELEAVLSPEALASLVSAPPPGPPGAFCPRCGARFRDGITTCAACEGVALLQG
jgi:hypothetical protein